MSNNNERMRILDQIERGEISVADGLRLLEALPAVETLDIEPALPLAQPDELSETREPPAVEGQSPAPEAEIPTQAQQSHAPASPAAALPPDAAKWRQFWMAPLWIGAAVTALGGWLMYRALLTSGVGFWFVCAAAPFALGSALLALAWSARTAPWLHLRVQQRPGERPQRIAISFPIPVWLTAWFLRNFGRHIPRLQDTALDEVIQAVGQTASQDHPIYIQSRLRRDQVDEGDEGEKVEIFIG